MQDLVGCICAVCLAQLGDCRYKVRDVMTEHIARLQFVVYNECFYHASMLVRYADNSITTRVPLGWPALSCLSMMRIEAFCPRRCMSATRSWVICRPLEIW